MALDRPSNPEAPRLAVVGCGRFGTHHLEIFAELAHAGRAQLLAAVDLDAKRRKEVEREFKVRVYADIEEMLRCETPEGVSIATPDPFHRAAALAAIKHGAHVLVEKPLATTAKDGRAMIAAAKKAGRLLQVDFHKRYDPVHLQLRDEIRAGKLGEVLYGYVHVENRITVPRDWFPAWAAKSSSSWFLGVHFYDLIRWALARDPVSVRATRQMKKLKSAGVATPDAVQAHVTFQGGAEITFQSAWCLPENFESIVNQGIRLVGTEGLAEVDTEFRGARLASGTEEHQRTMRFGFMQRVPGPGGRERTAGYGADAIAHFAENVAAIKNGAALKDLAGHYPDGEAGLWATRIAEAADKSCAKGGAAVKV